MTAPRRLSTLVLLATAIGALALAAAPGGCSSSSDNPGGTADSGAADSTIADGDANADATDDTLITETGGEPCSTDAECLPLSTGCMSGVCKQGFCALAPTPAGPAAQQALGDCQTAMCDGKGGGSVVEDPKDVPVAQSVCVVSIVCSGTPAKPVVTYAMPGTDCTADGMFPKRFCGDGAAVGTCVQCNVNGDCSNGDAGFGICTNHVCM